MPRQELPDVPLPFPAGENICSLTDAWFCSLSFRPVPSPAHPQLLHSPGVQIPTWWAHWKRVKQTARCTSHENLVFLSLNDCSSKSNQNGFSWPKFFFLWLCKRFLAQLGFELYSFSRSVPNHPMRSYKQTRLYFTLSSPSFCFPPSGQPFLCVFMFLFLVYVTSCSQHGNFLSNSYFNSSQSHPLLPLPWQQWLGQLQFQLLATRKLLESMARLPGPLLFPLQLCKGPVSSYGQIRRGRPVAGREGRALRPGRGGPWRSPRRWGPWPRTGRLLPTAPRRKRCCGTEGPYGDTGPPRPPPDRAATPGPALWGPPRAPQPLAGGSLPRGWRRGPHAGPGGTRPGGQRGARNAEKSLEMYHLLHF